MQDTRHFTAVPAPMVTLSLHCPQRKLLRTSWAQALQKESGIKDMGHSLRWAGLRALRISILRKLSVSVVSQTPLKPQRNQNQHHRDQNLARILGPSLPQGQRPSPLQSFRDKMLAPQMLKVEVYITILRRNPSQHIPHTLHRHIIFHQTKFQ